LLDRGTGALGATQRTIAVALSNALNVYNNHTPKTCNNP
jgi:hypothetical protein